ncbi:MAG TPA: hypothetical protein VGL96_14175 [Casimicrobiaceae bacterium]|jgi:hypothetical protein
MVQRLGTQVARAYQLQGQIRQTVRVAFAGYAVLERLQYPVFVLDDQRCITFQQCGRKGSGGRRVSPTPPMASYAFARPRTTSP